eukprot:CAMPEP_0202387754 /NCGR_PEP_ID=MMETSP1127-20130417/73764_1 /ASSEMBLY_ACC=CAM_ASM_000462 /TAXON_ID=3047 /ORGANISM="Dunaliella tertiolecta, Strain CCMP1320" /LENGTH=70 /DNA_ID=CAMNT_0048988887 /DNA_START=1390 /DNA_END=1602 /DNA_ORIENTATION=+
MAHTDVGVRGSGQVGGRATGGAFGPPPHMHVRRPRGPPHSVGLKKQLQQMLLLCARFAVMGLLGALQRLE